MLSMISSAKSYAMLCSAYDDMNQVGRGFERFRNRVNSDSEQRQRSGPTDLRNAKLNRETDTRELMQPRAGPSDLRYCKLQPEKDMRDLMKPKLKPMDTVDGRWTKLRRHQLCWLSRLMNLRRNRRDCLRMIPHQGAKDPYLE